VIAVDGRVDIAMTLTAPGCPVAGEMPGMVRDAVLTVAGVEEVAVSLIWEPPWKADYMTEDARLALGYF
jgi:metal-sulfur cluster biosynthetic enzyme